MAEWFDDDIWQWTGTGYRHMFNMGEPWKWDWVKEASHKGPQIVWFHLYEIYRVVKSIDPESRLVLA